MTNNIEMMIPQLEKFLKLEDRLDSVNSYEEYRSTVKELEKEKYILYEYMSRLESKLRQAAKKTRERYLETIQRRQEELISLINQKVKEYHNIDLIRCDESPNANHIYKLWEDFEVTSEKGGYAYGNRGVFSLRPALFHRRPEFIEAFPIKGEPGYAIMKERHCEEIYGLMREYLELRN